MRALLCYASPWPSQKSGPHSETLWPLCMLLPWKLNTQRLQRSLCFIKWLQGMTKCTWVSGMKDVRSDFDLFTGSPVKVIFSKEANCSEQGCWVFLPKSLSFSWTQPGLSLPANAAKLHIFMKSRWLHLASCLQYSVCAVLGWKSGVLRSGKTQTICLSLSITLLSSSLNKREQLPLFSFVLLEDKTHYLFLRFAFCL